MPISADAITHKKLVLVKQLYQQTLGQSASQQSVVGRIMSVIGFDLAVETAIKAVVGSLDASKSPADSFQSLIQQADSLLLKEGLPPVPDKAKIKHIHSIRNDAQHKAKYPNESDVSDCRTYTRDFLIQVFSDVWGLSFDKVSLTDLIQDETVKELLVNAETALSSGDYKRATEQAVAAFTWAMDRVKYAIVGRSIRPMLGAGILVKESNDRIKPSRDAYEALSKMQGTLLVTALGLNLTEYVRYEEVVADLGFAAHFFEGRDSPVFTYMGSRNKKEADSNDAEFLIAYVSNTVLQIENRVGRLDNPFGRKMRFH